MAQFDAGGWVARLAVCVERELLAHRVRLQSDHIRALAITCCPWHETSLILSVLTDRESVSMTGPERWQEIAAWRLFHFTPALGGAWPAANELMREAHEYYATGARTGDPADARDELCRSCANALLAPPIRMVLERDYLLAADFEFYAGHPDDEHNFCSDA